MLNRMLCMLTVVLLCGGIANAGEWEVTWNDDDAVSTTTEEDEGTEAVSSVVSEAYVYEEYASGTVSAVGAATLDSTYDPDESITCDSDADAYVQLVFTWVGGGTPTTLDVDVYVFDVASSVSSGTGSDNINAASGGTGASYNSQATSYVYCSELFNFNMYAEGSGQYNGILDSGSTNNPETYCNCWSGMFDCYDGVLQYPGTGYSPWEYTSYAHNSQNDDIEDSLEISSSPYTMEFSISSYAEVSLGTDSTSGELEAQMSSIITASYDFLVMWEEE